MSHVNAAPTTTLYASILDMDASELEAFRQRLRRRYSRDEIISELQASATRLGVSPTMREFAEDPEATIHPQTVVDHFYGSWNAAKRAAGLMPRRRASRDELIDSLASLGESLGRTPAVSDLDDARGVLPGKGVFIKEFGSFRKALAAAGFDAPTKDEKLERSVELGAAFFERTGRLPSFRDWERIRNNRDDIMSSWQLYRAFDGTGGAWSTFQFAIDQLCKQRTAITNAAA